MENKTQTKIRPFMLAVGASLVVLLVFLAVQLVQILPWAFSSLASIATSIDSYRPTTELNLATTRTVVNSGGEITLTWDKPRTAGDLEFSYQCDSNVTVTITETTLACNEIYEVDNDSLTLRLENEEQRFTDISYQLTFTPEEGDAVTEIATVTVVNANISGTSMNEEETGSEDTTATTTTQYRTVEIPYYIIPVSNPNGYTELSVSYVGAGIVRNNFFSRKDAIVANLPSGIRFAVKNLGTKTSEEWTYRAVLPDGSVYYSDEQSPLKPNEESLITLTFTSYETGVFPISVSIDTDREHSSSNNDFRATVIVTR